jgi:hypothetical protein
MSTKIKYVSVLLLTSIVGGIWGVLSFFMSLGCGWQEGGWYLCDIKEIVYFPFQIIVLASKITTIDNLIPPFMYIPLSTLTGILLGVLVGIIISSIFIHKKR